MAAMAEPHTGLPADNIGGDLTGASRARYTSPTNIGSYIWSAIVARKLHLIGEPEMVERLTLTLDALAKLERHGDSGMFYNWYDPATLQLLRTWPVDGSTVHPFVSSVDNAWLAAALMVVHNGVPRLRHKSDPLLDAMDFGFYYDSHARGPDVPVGLMRGGFWAQHPPGCSLSGNYRGRGANVYYTCHTYGAFNSETRMISYVAIARGQVPPAHYFAPWRTFPPTCDRSWQEMRPVGEYRQYLGVPVFEGAYRYRGLQFVPTWGGDMFEELMPNMFVPEEQWGPDSWARNHPVYVRGQIEHGLNDARYGHWGISPASDPAGGYREYGVDPMVWTPLATPATRNARASTTASRAVPAGRPNRYPPRTATAWSPRTRCSSRCGTHRPRRRPRWRSCATDSTSTDRAASTTRWPYAVAPRPGGTSPSTRE
jgi:hypothetical protein